MPQPTLPSVTGSQSIKNPHALNLVKNDTRSDASSTVCEDSAEPPALKDERPLKDQGVILEGAVDEDFPVLGILPDEAINPPRVQGKGDEEFSIFEVPGSWQKRVGRGSSIFESMYHASKGWHDAVHKERFLKLLVYISIWLVTLGFIVGLDLVSWCIMLMCIGIVMVTELVNTAIERFVDLLVGHRYSKFAKEAKDTAAGATLCSIVFGLGITLTLLVNSFVINSHRFFSP
jgi:undecaprenol kinase